MALAMGSVVAGGVGLETHRARGDRLRRLALDVEVGEDSAIDLAAGRVMENVDLLAATVEEVVLERQVVARRGPAIVELDLGRRVDLRVGHALTRKGLMQKVERDVAHAAGDEDREHDQEAV